MIKKYLIVSKQDQISNNVREQLKRKLKGILEYDEKCPDLIITIGGDGTMLYALHLYYNLIDKVYFLGVHTGTLGFYTDYMSTEIDNLVEDIQKNKLTIKYRSLLEVSIVKEGESSQYYALNEARVENNLYTQVIDVYINEEHLETFRGNGLCVSTASGSTAYNKSLGGSVLHPSLEAMQLTEIAGIHHNAYRSLGSSLVLSSTHTINLTLKQIEGAILGIDQKIIHLNQPCQINIKMARSRMKCVQYKPLTFVSRIRRSFISK